MDNEALYQERLARIKKAISFEPVDRVPVVFSGSAFAPRYVGMKLADYVNDPHAANQTQLDTLDKLAGFDGVNSALPGGRMSATPMGLTRMKIPGRELPEDSLWQVVETEVMKPEEYDRVIEIGWMAFMQEAMPRVCDDIPAALESLAWMQANGERELAQYRERGYPILSAGAVGMVPLEMFAGARSLPQLVFDFHRRPDKVQEAMDAMMPELLRQIEVLAASGSPALGTWVGGWRGAPSFLGPRDFDRFFWPYFRQMVEKVASLGMIAVLHLDQDWTREIAKLGELPAQRCILNPDGMTDVRKFRQMVGDRMAIMGDVPAALLALGSPDKVKAYVRALIEDVGPRGLIIAPGCEAPINAKPENLEAMISAAHEYGPVS